MKKYFLLITIVLSTIFSYGQVDVQTAGKIIVGVHAIGKRIGYGIRVHRNEKKIKKMEKSRDPKASCYYIDENGYLQIQSGPCYLPDGSYFKKSYVQIVLNTKKSIEKNKNLNILTIQ